MQLHRLVQQLLDLALEVGLGVVEVDVVVDLPVAFRRRLAAGDPQQVPGLQLAHPLEQGLAGEAELEGEVVLEAVGIGLDRRQHRHQRLRLRGEVEDVADDRVVKGLDPEAVPRADQLLAGLVPDRVGEHPAQPLQRVGAPAVVGPQHDLGVAAGAEGAAADLGAQLGVVVDLAVVGDPAPGLVGHRLVPGRGGVDDREAPVGEADVPTLVGPDPLVVGAAVADQLVHHLELALEVGDRLSVEVDRAADSAHRTPRG